MLLGVAIVFEALAGSEGVVGEIGDHSILVFYAVAEGGVGPGALGVVALIFEADAIDVIVFEGGIVELITEAVDAGGIAVEVDVVVAVEIVEGGEAMLPSGGRVDGELDAAQEIVLV